MYDFLNNLIYNHKNFRKHLRTKSSFDDFFKLLHSSIGKCEGPGLKWQF